MKRRWWAVLYGLLGLLVMGVGLPAGFIGDSSQSLAYLLIDSVLNAGAGVGLIYGAYWHWRNPLEENHYPRLLLWMILATSMFVSLGTITLFIGSNTVLRSELVEVIELNLGVGLLSGLVVGTIRSITIEQTRATARAEAEAEALEAERERLAELNGLLRHYILNALTVIDGHASLLSEAAPDDEQHSVEKIRNQVESIVELIKNIDWVAEINPSSTRAIDLDRMLREAKESVTQKSAVSVKLPTSNLYVEGNSSLSDAFRYLCDAIERGSAPDGTITVTVDRIDDDVRITAVGKRAEFSDAVADAMFEPIGTEVGLKLFMANKIFSRFGSLGFDNSEPDEIRFECRLPMAEADS